jgi:hypothetical protein
MAYQFPGNARELENILEKLGSIRLALSLVRVRPPTGLFDISVYSPYS